MQGGSALSVLKISIDKRSELPHNEMLSKALADLAELVDAHDSGSCGSNPLGVQVPRSAPNLTE